MPPKKFMSSSKISDVWKDSGVPSAQKKRKASLGKDDDLDSRVTSEQLRQLVQKGGLKSERSALAQELEDLKKLKGSNQAKSVNYADLQKKQRLA